MMNARRILAVIDDATANGTDAYGLAVRVAADAEACCVERMIKAAADLGLVVEGGDIESIVASIALAAQGVTTPEE